MSVPRFQVRVLPAGHVFATAEPHTLLEDARAAGIRLPSSCRNGTCRACLCRAERGTVRYRVDWPGVSADEREQGWILPCVAVAESDLVLVQPGARCLPRPEDRKKAGGPA